VTENGIERQAERTVYGEAQGGAKNHRTRVHQVFDGAGVVTNVAYDFKGNLLEGRRDLLLDYKQSVNWLAHPAAGDGGFTTVIAYDALNRPLAVTTPDKSVYRPTFNEASLLEKIDVNVRGAVTPTPFVIDIDYNARGQRTLIHHGNDAQTSYEYDARTFRLVRLKTTRPPGRNGLSAAIFNNAETIQNLHYTYDPSGNVTRIADDALAVIVEDNQQVAPVCEYSYDAVYRLMEATGREHAGQSAFAANANFRDYPFAGFAGNPNDLQALRNYTEQYEYDAAGNFEKLVHQATNGSWTRTYTYNEAPVPDPPKHRNRLVGTTIGQATETYTHDLHGNMTQMGHLTLMQWNFKDQLHSTSSQSVNNGSPETTFYVYDAAGQRVRKVTERQNGTRKTERIYVGGFEIYREFGANGQAVNLARETFHVMDDKQRVALIETRTFANGVEAAAPPSMPRYQFGNHLRSAILELDGKGALISYEEYHPHGSSSYQVISGTAEVSLKRYRYTGKERDEESGLYFHGARYYAPWLGRWTACDPKGLVDGPNLYRYTFNNPIRLSDPTGTQGVDQTKKPQAQEAAPKPEPPPSRYDELNKLDEQIAKVENAIREDEAKIKILRHASSDEMSEERRLPLLDMQTAMLKGDQARLSELREKRTAVEQREEKEEEEKHHSINLDIEHERAPGAKETKVTIQYELTLPLLGSQARGPVYFMKEGELTLGAFTKNEEKKGEQAHSKQGIELSASVKVVSLEVEKLKLPGGYGYVDLGIALQQKVGYATDEKKAKASTVLQAEAKYHNGPFFIGLGIAAGVQGSDTQPYYAPSAFTGFKF
jgi:RHS repeat-associated protein